jgi:hypothetical protein
MADFRDNDHEDSHYTTQNFLPTEINTSHCSEETLLVQLLVCNELL